MSPENLFLPRLHRLRLPAFGRELAALRRRGHVPVTKTGWIIVAYGWAMHRLIGAQHPRVVVDGAPGQYDFSALAGLDVLIAHEPQDRDAVHALGDAIWLCKPRSLTAAPIPCEVPDAYRYWHPGGEHV